MFPEAYAAAGIVLLLLAFFLNAGKRLRRYTYAYNVMNLLGAAALAVYALQINSVVFAVFESVWVFIAAYFTLHKVVARNRLTAWDEEPTWAYDKGDLRGLAAGTSGSEGSWDDEGADLRSVGRIMPKVRKKRRIVRKKKWGAGKSTGSSSDESGSGEATPFWPWQQ